MELCRSVRLSSRCHLSSFSPAAIVVVCSSRSQGKPLHFANLIPALLSLSPLSAFVLKIPKLPDLPSLCALCLANIYSSLPPLCDSLEDSQQRQNYRTVKKHNNIYASVC